MDKQPWDYLKIIYFFRQQTWEKAKQNYCSVSDVLPSPEAHSLEQIESRILSLNSFYFAFVLRKMN